MTYPFLRLYCGYIRNIRESSHEVGMEDTNFRQLWGYIPTRA